MGLAIASLARSESVMERRRKVRDLTLRAGGHSSMDKVVSLWAGHDPAKPPDGPFSLAGGSAWKSTSWLSWNAAFRYPRRTFFGHGSRFFGVLAIGDG